MARDDETIELNDLQQVSLEVTGLSFKPVDARFRPSVLSQLNSLKASKTGVHVVIPASSPFLSRAELTDEVREHGAYRGQRGLVVKVAPDSCTVRYDSIRFEDVEVGVKKRKRPLPVVPATGSSSAIRSDSFSTKIVYNKDGQAIRMDSKLEGKHARLLDLLGLTWDYYRPSEHERVKFQVGPDESAHYYTPDFFVHGVPTVVPGEGDSVSRDLILEIKPLYPDAEALAKCEITSRAFPEALTVMFAGKLKYGFAAVDKARTYEHTDGLRGVAWLGGERIGGDAGWFVSNRGEAMLLVESVPRHLQFPDEKLLDCLAHAASFAV